MMVCGEKSSEERIIKKNQEKRQTVVDVETCLIYIRMCLHSQAGFSVRLRGGKSKEKESRRQMSNGKRQRIRVCLKAYDHKLIDVSAAKIVETAKRTDAKVAGPIPLPTKRRVYCVLRSPHVDKKSREHFEMRTHKRIIDIYEPTAQTTDELSRMDLPAGVDIEVKL